MSWKDDGNFSTLEDIQAYGDARAEEERGRIIALLEAWVTDDNGNFDETLALIKGEQK